MSKFTESALEQAALAWLEGLGWQVLFGPSIAPGEPGTERLSYEQAFLPGRLREALLPKLMRGKNMCERYGEEL